MFKRIITVFSVIIISGALLLTGCSEEETVPDTEDQTETVVDDETTGEIDFVEVSEEESRTIAEEFVRSSATFSFDGMEDTLVLTETITMRCPFCWLFVFEFDSSHGGYGDRTGMILTQAIMHHRAAVAVSQGEIASASLDGTWDMIDQEEIASEGETVESIDVNLSIANLLETPVYETTVSIQGTVSLLGELLCPCFELSSDGESIEVWYGLMVENDGTEMTDVSVIGIENGDTVIVTGVLKGPDGMHYSEGDFWAERIEPVD